MKYTTRPLSDRTWLRPETSRKPSRFDSNWTSTLSVLRKEIDLLDGRDVVIECDVREQDIRIDGGLRANARADTPAVVIAFESKHGPQVHRCDRFVSSWSDQGPDWQQNVRAIALTLQALRDMERWGAVETGQQYAGFKAIGGGSATATAMPASMTRDHARALLLRVSGYGDLDDFQGWGDSHLEAKIVRSARFAAHPDRNAGDHDLTYRVDEAARVLGLAR